MTRIAVAGESPYDVVVAAGAVGELAEVLPGSARQALVVHQESVAHVALEIEEGLARAGIMPTLAMVPDGEAAKTVDVAAPLWSVLGQKAFTRSDIVIGVGGGAVTDLAGFVAATWLRGVAVIQVPTTVLGMVDAAVGGKTGINTPEGKNLVGAFHPPSAVLCDLATLRTLPPAELVSGMAEVVKAGFIADPLILDLVETSRDQALDPASDVLQELIERAVRVKAGVVSHDLRESGLREILNYGHTLGHAIEKVEDFHRRHGEAVSVGMVFAAELARLAGRLDADTVTRHRIVLRGLGLPTTYDGASWPALLDAMRVDKKARGAQLRFVVLDGLARPGRLEGPSDALLAQAFERVCA